MCNKMPLVVPTIICSAFSFSCVALRNKPMTNSCCIATLTHRNIDFAWLQLKSVRFISPFVSSATAHCGKIPTVTGPAAGRLKSSPETSPSAVSLSVFPSHGCCDPSHLDHRCHRPRADGDRRFHLRSSFQAPSSHVNERANSR